MPGSAACTVYVGNLDERVSERVLYDILIQAGRVLDLYIPRDRETDRPKGFAFAEYETEEVADYVVKLFSGLVTLHGRTLKFAISGQDKPSPNLQTAATPAQKPFVKPVTPPVPIFNMDLSPHSVRSSTTCRIASQQVNYGQVPRGVAHQSSGYRPHIETNSYDYSRRAFGSPVDSLSRFRSNHVDLSRPRYYPY